MLHFNNSLLFYDAIIDTLVTCNFICMYTFTVSCWIIIHVCLLWFTLHKYFVIWEAIVKIKLYIHIFVVFWCRYVIKTCNVLLHLYYKHITCEYINSLNHTPSLILSGVIYWCHSRAVTNLHIEAELLCSQHYIHIVENTKITVHSCVVERTRPDSTLDVWSFGYLDIYLL